MSHLNEGLHFVPVNDSNIPVYIRTGTKSYFEHYTYLWKNGNPAPYIDTYFTGDAVSAELRDTNNALYIVYEGQQAAGTLKITKDSPLPGLPAMSAMLLDKIYLLKEFAGKGIGGKALDFTESLGRSLGKSAIWLYSMQGGPALSFYLKHGFVIREEKRLHYPEVREEHRMMHLLIKPLEPRPTPGTDSQGPTK